MALQPQPDFDAVAGCSSNAAEHANIPAIQQGQQIIAMLQEMRQEMNQGFDQILRQMHQTEARQIAMEANTIARGMNNRVRGLDEPLEPLVAVTNEEIEGFPQTPADIDLLPVSRINELLTLLGQPVRGPEAEKRRRLKISVGFVLTWA
ncbi:hypothetical protein HD806DRAFT_355443 [Xylariaceae sp. AK1471]|nr:hypothetical protein HD806DRAFT_355443 [Xylariaceae sp. AK1471]